MTDETKTPEEAAPEAPPAVEDGTATAPDSSSEGTTDTPPPVAGEQNEPASDPTLLGALTQQENAMLRNLQRRVQQLIMELGKIELQKDSIKEQIKATDEQSQGILVQIGKRLNIQKDVVWSVSGDGNARALPPQMLQAMQQGRMPPPMAPPARVSQPPQGGETTKE